MTGPLTEALIEVLRPLVADLVAQEVAKQLADAGTAADGPSPYLLTVAQYADRHQATPEAVRARIRRGRLAAIRPPGSREYLIPADDHPGGHDG